MSSTMTRKRKRSSDTTTVSASVVAGNSSRYSSGDGTISTPSSLAKDIIKGMKARADTQSKNWFTNYVKGTVWIGCTTPVTRQVVQQQVMHHRDNNNNLTNDKILDQAIQLLQQEECDVKLAGMILLSEFLPLQDLATEHTLERLENEVLQPNKVGDWSSADWFANKVLRKINFSGDHNLVHRVLDYTKKPDNLWYRRCGVVSFLTYEKHREQLPPDFGTKLIQACERTLLASPEERFAQTGVAWVLRYTLLENCSEKDQALAMIVKHGSLWSTEAKKSMIEKLSKKDPRRQQILSLS